ncbi:MAG TPA: hypothetical protein VGO43_13535, partial [Pyrinomonadaceae bacterium]|nr:hypothetical protein [Pyrinomonadaceae bacterium]
RSHWSQPLDAGSIPAASTITNTMWRLLLLTVVLCSTQIVLGQRSDLQENIARQIEQIKTLPGDTENFQVPPLATKGVWPVQELIKCGMDAIPELIPLLADDSFTNSYFSAHRFPGDIHERLRVNRFVIFVIDQITDHQFYLPGKPAPGTTADPNLPKTIKELQDQVYSWWAKNGKRTLLERKLDDVKDLEHPNRFAAYEWLGKSKEEAGRLALERRIDTLLTGEVNSLKQSEMVGCAEALAKIGDPKSAPYIQKVCEHLSYWIYMAYRPIEEGRGGIGSNQISNLFSAFHSLSSLGRKSEALSRLQEIGTKYMGEMELSTQQEFLRSMEAANDWCDEERLPGLMLSCCGAPFGSRPDGASCCPLR